MKWTVLSDNRSFDGLHSESIDDDIFIIAHIPQIHPMPEGNQHLFVQDTQGQYI